MAKGTFNLSNIQVGGRVGDLLFLPQPDGRVVVRRMPTDLPARTPLQKESAARMKVVGAAWRALPEEDAQAWDRYVEAARGWPLPTGGKAPTQAYGAFLGLGAKCLQMRPREPLPTRPPETPFLGDGIGVTVSGSPSFRSGERKGPGDGESSSHDLALPPQPPPSQAKEGEPSLTFSSTAPNAPGVVTELLLQRLKGAHRKPTAKGYRTRAFVAFGTGSLSLAIPCEAGAWALAVRFVRADSGQETGIVPLGKVVVPG